MGVLQVWSELTGKPLRYFTHGDTSQAPELPQPTHAGVAELLRDRAMVRDLGITPEEIDMLRTLVPVTPDGYLEIDTKVHAVHWLYALRNSLLIRDENDTV